MLRLQWYALSGISRQGLGHLASRMIGDRYTDKGNSGFFVDDVRPHHLIGRFVERELVSQTVEDPFGNSSHFEHTVFHITRFQINLQKQWIEIQNAPRNLSPFFSQLAEHSEFSASVEPIGLQPLEWFHNFRKVVPDALMTRVIIDDFPIAEGVIARVSLSADVDVQRHIEKATGKRFVTASAIQVLFTLHSALYRLNVSATGRIKFIAAAQEEALDVVRSSISHKRRPE